jgi:hypothetical protein
VSDRTEAMTHESACIKAVSETNLCKGLTDIAPYSGDIIIACGIFLLLMCVALLTVMWYIGTGHHHRRPRHNEQCTAQNRAIREAEGPPYPDWVVQCRLREAELGDSRR